MAQFECRIIERLVRVYRVEAKDADEADMLLQIGDSRLYQVDSFPIDSEDGEAWHEVAGEYGEAQCL
jgi:hypothetical protein